MKITKDKLNLEQGLEKEWVITNGIGGFSSSTIIGANTRKYHGLLIAPLTPPARRFLILSKIDESITIGTNRFDLYTNICKNYIAHGYQYLETFEKEIIPTFEYNVNGVMITKKICMEHGVNTVGISYKIKNINEQTTLTLAPIINFRDFHQVNAGHHFNIKQQHHGGKVKAIVDNHSETPIYMNASEGRYIEHTNDTFENMFYIQEEKRGFFPEENHAVPGVYEIEIKPNEEKEISIICSFEENIEEKRVSDMIQKEEDRIQKLYETSGLLEGMKSKKQKELIQKYIIAADNFVVYRPHFGLHTVIAGYPWFLDWGRDTLISYEGLILLPKRFDIAKEILRMTIRDIKYGLVPNGYSGYDNRPLYNSVDASLLLFEQVQKYLEYTNDYDFIQKEIYPSLKEIIKHYATGIDIDDNNIYLDTDGLMVSGTSKTQNTWMDAKYEGVAITPRNGKAVEINSMWYNSNKIMEDLSNRFGDIELTTTYKKYANKCKRAFLQKFYNSKKKCLYDVIGDAKIRPNQVFALSLTYPVINPNTEEAQNIIKTVEKKLLNAYGLQTLAKEEENFVAVYEGNGWKRDSSYHQGITWTWLLGLYYNALKNMQKVAKTQKAKKEISDKIDKLVTKTTKTFEKEINENGCIGSVAEMYDSKKPQLPKGSIAQAWSIAETFRIIMKK